MTIQVEALAENGDAWDAFVREAADGTFFHLFGWREVLHQAFGFRPHYLAARRGDRIVGVLPLCELVRPFGGSCLLSLPFAVQAGICARDATARDALEVAALDLATSFGAGYVELRDGVKSDRFSERPNPYYRFRRAITASDEENLAAVPRKQRRMIRVAQRSGLRSQVGGDLEVFYDLYARSVRRLGTPVFALSFFRRLREVFGEDCVVLTVWRDTKPAAAVLSFFFGDTVLPYYAGSRRDLQQYAPNDFMYWELMRYAARRGARVFDFGRSREGTGAFAFKRHWGFEPEPLRYRACCVADDCLPQRSLDDSKVRALRRAWSWLPLWITKIVGPPLVRRMGPYYT